MLASRRIWRNYDVFLDLLKFSMKNDDKSEFKRFSSVSTLNSLLKELEERIDKNFPVRIKSKPHAYEVLLESIFKEELEDYRPHINTSSKKELVRRFESFMNLIDSSMDMYDGVTSFENDIIDKEIERIKAPLEPLLIAMRNQN